MNIPVPLNDLDREENGGFTASINEFFRNFAYEASTWSSAKDLAIRFAVPFFGIAAAAVFRQALERRERQLADREMALAVQQKQVMRDREQLDSNLGFDKPLSTVISEMMAAKNRQSYKAVQEVEQITPMIQEVLKVKCSPFTARHHREPMEKSIRERLLRNPSPLDEYAQLKQTMFEDILNIYTKDIEHCDNIWPIGNHNNGELYKVYAENWKLRIELEKHKSILEQLKSYIEEWMDPCSECGFAAERSDGSSSTFTLIASRMLETVREASLWLLRLDILAVINDHYVHLVRDILQLDEKLILQYFSLLWYPLIIFLILPCAILVFLYASALFLTIYKWRSQLQEAYHHNFWDGARQTLAVVWEAQSYIWFGYEVVGLDKIPDSGPALLVYYHAALPLDMYYLIPKLLLYKKRLIHSIGDRFLFHVPGFQTLMRVFNVQAGTRESCVSLLQAGEIVSISPGGVREALFSRNYQIIWNKRLGFARVALESGAPIIPIFTSNSRQAFNTLAIGDSFVKRLYERTKLPVGLLYGGFPVKLKTYVGDPIYSNRGETTPEQLSSQVQKAMEQMIRVNQRQPGSILMALLDRFS